MRRIGRKTIIYPIFVETMCNLVSALRIKILKILERGTRRILELIRNTKVSLRLKGGFP